MSTAVITAIELLERDGAAIARGLRRQDPDLLERLIELYQHRLLRYLVYLTANRELAEDLFQETWVRVLERGGQYNGKSRFDTWLLAIARHLVIDTSRKKTASSLEALTEPAEGAPLELAAIGRSAFDTLNLRELGDRIGSALGRIEAAQREVVMLRFQEDMTLEEIAEITCAPLSTVKSRLYRGLEALRPALQADAGGLA
jgi:RNA polymerase sigma-70 factor (ECF subfamily)